MRNNPRGSVGNCKGLLLLLQLIKHLIILMCVKDVFCEYEQFKYQHLPWKPHRRQSKPLKVMKNNLVLHDIRNAEYLNATCMDGSNSMFYIDRNSHSKNWIIHLQAGGSCITEDDCLHRANGPLGSSLYLTTFMTGQFSMAKSQLVNPTFYKWNKVFIPYCSGDVFAGRMPKTLHPYGIPMLGHYIVVAVIKQLIMDYGIANSETKVLFGGTSAGGLGTLANIDFIQGLVYPAEVKGYNDGGWFTLFPNFGEKFFDPGLPKFFNVLTELFDKYWNGFVDTSCRAQMPRAAACLYGELAMKHISTPMYIMVAQWDSYQLTKLVAGEFRPVPLPPKKTREEKYVSMFGNNTRRSLEMIRKKGKSGVFAPACYSHTFLTSCIDGNICQYPPSDRFQIEGKTAYQALSEWYTTAGEKGSYVEEMSEVPSCNPSCCSLLCLKCKLPPFRKEKKHKRREYKYESPKGQRKSRVFFYSKTSAGVGSQKTVFVMIIFTLILAL